MNGDPPLIAPASSFAKQVQKLNRTPNCAARGNPVPVGIEGRTALALPNPFAIRAPLGSLETPATTRLPLASRRPPSWLTVKPVGNEASVVNTPLNVLDGKPAGPTRLEM